MAAPKKCKCAPGLPCGGFDGSCAYCGRQDTFEECPAGPESTRKGFAGALSSVLGHAAAKAGEHGPS